MQNHSNNTPLKSAVLNDWFGINLRAEVNGISANTIVSFNEAMSEGLDVTYDAGLLRSGNGLEIYSRLKNNNEVDFAVQALPSKESCQTVIPIGIDSDTSGELTISANITNLPNGASFLLEDKLTGIVTNLTTDKYSVHLSSNSKGTGRFYIYLSKTGITGFNENKNQPAAVMAWSSNRVINIQGQLTNNTRVRIFDLHGRPFGEFQLSGSKLNQIPLPDQINGICILELTGKSPKATIKLIIK
jgi:hypothetical protein